ncbi:MAG: methyl-accepting chemotaxis protein [Pirellulaceae bacterium]
MASTIRSQQIAATTAVLAATWLLAAVWHFADRGQRRQLKSLLNVFERLAAEHCDLTVRAPQCGRGDLVRLSKLANSFLDRFQALVCEVNQEIFELSSSSAKLSDTATMLGAGSASAMKQTTTVSAAAEELSVTMKQTASDTERVSQNAIHVAQSVEEIRCAISKVATNAEHAASVARRASELSSEGTATIEALGTAAREISEVVNVIRDVADQTKLLSLNATVEAAHAGDAGHGFAVVAGEVKQLASQTDEATDDIGRRVEAIQAAVQKTTDVIDGIAKIVGELSETSNCIATAMEQQTATCQTISQHVSTSADASERLSRGVDETSLATEQISKSLAALEVAARETHKGSDETKLTEGEMMKMVDRLQSTTAMFKARSGFESASIKTAHNAWKSKLADLLAGRSSLDPSEVSSHKNCKFGKWYFVEGRTQFGDNATFKEIDVYHEKVHEMAREIAQLVKDEARELAANRFHDFQGVTAHLFKLLDDLEHESSQPTMVA